MIFREKTERSGDGRLDPYFAQRSRSSIYARPPLLSYPTYHESSNNWPMCYVVENSLLGKGAKIAAKKELLSPSERHKKEKEKHQTIPYHTRGGNSNDIAHRPIIRDFTVLVPQNSSQAPDLRPNLEGRQNIR